MVHDSFVRSAPVAKTPKGAEIEHRFSVLTHAKLQGLGSPMCFNEVSNYIKGILAQVSMSNLGAKLHEDSLANLTSTKGKIASAALAVCVDCGVYQPIVPIVQIGNVPAPQKS